MGELEEKLNSILSSPDEMAKIMDMAKSLSVNFAPKDEPKKEEGKLPLFGDIDPKMIGVMTRLLTEYNTTRSDKTALLSAMKPYVREQNRDALDKAGDILKMTKLAKIAMTELGGIKGEQV